MMFTIGDSAPLKPMGDVILHLSVNELQQLCNRAASLFHSQVWPIDAKMDIVVPNEQSFREWVEERQ